MDTFEYKTIRVKTSSSIFKNPRINTEETDLRLNNLGKEGWELVGLTDMSRNGWSTNLTLFFKRKRG